MNPSASTLARVAVCAASHVLPQAGDAGSYKSNRGLGIHAFLARVAMSPAERTSFLADVPEPWRETCARIDVASALDGLSNVRAEVAYAFDVKKSTARFIGINIGREYGELGEDELPCTDDIEGDLEDGTPVVLDWKTGMDVGPVEKNWQVILQALVRAAMKGWPERIEGRIAYIDEDGSTTVDRHVFTFDELDERERELGRILHRVELAASQINQGVTPTVVRGDHCKYCPAMHACPAQVALIRAALPDLESVASTIEALTLEQAGAAWEKWKQIRTLGERIEKSLKERAEVTPLPLPNGKVLKMVPTSGREYLDTKSGTALLRMKGASEEEIAAVTKRSKSSQTAKECNA